MLIITRRAGETVTIGDDATITVLGAKGKQVRIGVIAPEDVEVHRAEVFYREHPELEAPEHAGDQGHASSRKDASTHEVPVTTKRSRHVR